MDIGKADIVRSTAGRDKGRIFFVLETEGEFLLLADGSVRRVERPKRKKRRHTELLPDAPETRAAAKIRGGEKITNSELRRTLAGLGEAGNPDQEG